MSNHHLGRIFIFPLLVRILKLIIYLIEHPIIDYSAIRGHVNTNFQLLEFEVHHVLIFILKIETWREMNWISGMLNFGGN